MKRTTTPFFLLLALALAGSARAEWVPYSSNVLGLSMLVPDSTPNIDLTQSIWPSATWGDLDNDVNIIVNTGDSGLTRDSLLKTVVQFCGFPANRWQKLSDGTGTAGWVWNETYRAQFDESCIYAVIGKGPNRSYMIYYSTPARNIELGTLGWGLLANWSTSLKVFATATSTTTANIVKTSKDTKEFAKYNRPWGWFKAHTYDLGSMVNIKTISGKALAGPSEKKNVKYTWQVRVSNDNVNWTSLGTISVTGAKEEAFGPVTANRSVRYVQIFTNDNGYVDDSGLTLTREVEGAKPSPKPNRND